MFDFKHFVVWVWWVIIALLAGIGGLFVWVYMGQSWQGMVTGVAAAAVIGWFGADFVKMFIKKE